MLAALALVGAIAIGWGLPGARAERSASALTSHAVRVADVASDAVVAVAAPVAEAVAPRAEHGTTHERVRDVLVAAVGAIALLLLVARRRHLTFARSRVVRVAVVGHGGRAPPV